MSEFAPLRLEIAGTPRIFTYEDTEARLYRVTEDTVHDHVRVQEYGTQIVHLFNVPNLLTILVGQEVYGHSYSKKQLDKATKMMDDKLGWNARMLVEDYAPEDIVERHIKIATVALKNEVVVIPHDW